MVGYSRINAVTNTVFLNSAFLTSLNQFSPLSNIYRHLRLKPSPQSASTTSYYLSTRSQTEYEYNWIDGAEDLDKYRPGGYHPVMIGDTLHGRYHIVDKLGFGGYSTIWLARDTRMEKYVAVKIGIANVFLNETKILRALSSSSVHPGRQLIPLPLDEFEVRGPNGTHPCYTMTPAQCSLTDVSFSRLFPLEVARALAGGLTLAIAYIHSQGYVHGGLSFY